MRGVLEPQWSLHHCLSEEDRCGAETLHVEAIKDFLDLLWSAGNLHLNDISE